VTGGNVQFTYPLKVTHALITARPIWWTYSGDRLATLPIIFVYIATIYLASAVVVPKWVNYGAVILILLALADWFGRSKTEFKIFSSLSKETKLVYFGFLFYTLFGLLSLLNNADWRTANWRFESYYPFVLAGLLLLILQRKLFTQKFLMAMLLSGCCVGALLVAALSAFDVFAHGALRAGEIAGFSENIFGYMAGTYVLLMLCAMLTVSNNLVRACTVVALLAAFYAVVLSGSRGTMFALSGALLLGFVFMALASRRNRMFSVVTLIVISIGLISFLRFNPYWGQQIARVPVDINRYLSGNYEHNAISSRLTLYDGGIQIWYAHPFIGTGLGDGQNDLDQLIAANKVKVHTASFATFHNIYIDVLATTGIFGFISMLFGIFILPLNYFIRAWKYRLNDIDRFAALAGMNMIVYGAIFGLTHSWLYLRNLPFTLVVMVFLLALSSRYKNH